MRNKGWVVASRDERRAALVVSTAAALTLAALTVFGARTPAGRASLALARQTLGGWRLGRIAFSGRPTAAPAARRSVGPPPTAAPPVAAFSDHDWWAQALAVRHWPAPVGLSLAADSAPKDSVAVFVYHQVSPVGWPLQNGPDAITPARLATEFAFFRARHVPTLTPAQFVAFVQGRERVPRGSVFLTFDNGLEGVYRYAYPLALRYHVHITVFVIGRRLRDRWRPGDRFLAWDQVTGMAKSGLVSVESETYDLHSVETIARGRYGPYVERRWETYPLGHEEPLASYLRRLRYGFTQQRLVFWRHLHTTPTLLVWPFSTYNLVAESEARAAGYAAAFAVYPGVVTPRPGADLFALPRNPATFMWDNVPAEYDALYGTRPLTPARGALVAASAHGPERRT